MTMELFYIAFGVIGLLIAMSDFLTYRIPNTLVAVFLILFIAHALIFQNAHALVIPGIFFVGILVFGFILFRFRLIGAGDAKLLAVTISWTIYMRDALTFILMVSVIGAILGIFYLKYGFFFENLRKKYVVFLQQVLKKINLDGIIREPEAIVSQSNSNKKRQMMPYGVAIGLGCLILIIMKLAHHEL